MVRSNCPESTDGLLERTSGLWDTELVVGRRRRRGRESEFLYKVLGAPRDWRGRRFGVSVGWVVEGA